MQSVTVGTALLQAAKAALPNQVSLPATPPNGSNRSTEGGSILGGLSGCDASLQPFHRQLNFYRSSILLHPHLVELDRVTG